MFIELITLSFVALAGSATTALQVRTNTKLDKLSNSQEQRVERAEAVKDIPAKPLVPNLAPVCKQCSVCQKVVHRYSEPTGAVICADCGR